MARTPVSLDLEAIGQLVDAAGHGPNYKVRNSLIVRMMYGHALRLNETVALTWGQLDLFNKKLRLQRKRRDGSLKLIVRELDKSELSSLYELKENAEKRGKDDAVFVSNRGEALTEDGVRKMLATAARRAKIKVPAGPRVIRRSAGVRVGQETRDVDAVKAMLGVEKRSSAIAVIPVAKHRGQSNPWI